MGIYHYEQIANWGAEDLARIDAQLRGFEGRASRDDWIDEAQALIAERANT